jgi:hypothetical protein
MGCTVAPPPLPSVADIGRAMLRQIERDREREREEMEARMQAARDDVQQLMVCLRVQVPSLTPALRSGWRSATNG